MQCEKCKAQFPKGCKKKSARLSIDKQKKSDKPVSLIQKVLQDYIEDQDADPLTARLDGKYVWVETGLALDKGKPQPI